MHLSEYTCSGIKTGEPAVTDEEIESLHPWVPAWSLTREGNTRKLINRFTFDDAEQSELFVERVLHHADLQGQGHEPVIKRDKALRSVLVEWWTPALGDVHPNDFIMAAKTDAAYTLTLVGNEGDMSADTPQRTLESSPVYRRVLARRKASPPAGL